MVSTPRSSRSKKPQPTLVADVLLGSHLSIAGGMHLAIEEAERLHFDCVQVFTKNQQQWKAKPLTEEAISAWTSQVKRLSWQQRTVSHASYLINLASPDDELWNRSIDLMRVELERCEVLGIPFLVHHPGAYTSSSEPQGLARIALAYKHLFKQTAGFRTVSCLENTVGSGSNLGAPFEQLADLRARIIEATAQPERVGFCFDTCHAHAAGYDLSDRGQAQAVLDAFDTTCGLEHIRVVHLNDSVAPAASRKDRHAHIGEGTIGQSTRHDRLSRSGFAAVVNADKLRGVPMILETPKGQSEAGTPFDTLNANRLRKLVETA